MFLIYDGMGKSNNQQILPHDIGIISSPLISKSQTSQCYFIHAVFYNPTKLDIFKEKYSATSLDIV